MHINQALPSILTSLQSNSYSKNLASVIKKKSNCLTVGLVLPIPLLFITCLKAHLTINCWSSLTGRGLRSGCMYFWSTL